jgi:hypothetical protein
VLKLLSSTASISATKCKFDSTTSKMFIRNEKEVVEINITFSPWELNGCIIPMIAWLLMNPFSSPYGINQNRIFKKLSLTW